MMGQSKIMLPIFFRANEAFLRRFENKNKKLAAGNDSFLLDNYVCECTTKIIKKI